MTTSVIPHAPSQCSPAERWRHIPAELRERPQWVLAAPGDDKSPRKPDGGFASSTAPGTWSDFDTASVAAAKRGWGIGYVLSAEDPYTCIDLDVKNEFTHPNQPDKWTTPDQLERHDSIVRTMASYTERSRSGLGRHVWVRAQLGKGCKRESVELYSQERYIICTGDVVEALPVADRQDLIANMASRMRPIVLPDAELRADEPGDDMGCCIAAIAIEDDGEMGRLMRGDWEVLTDEGAPKYASQSEADMALLLMLGRLTVSNGACREAFRLSMLGRREKAQNDDRYLNLTLRKVRAGLADEAFQVAEGSRLAGDLFWPERNPLDELRVDWTNGDDAEVPDVVIGLVADEDVTLLGGHGGVGKSLLALQMACAVATGGSILHRPTDRMRVLYYSAEDGRKRLTRRVRSLVEHNDLDGDLLRENLLLLDASEVEPLYGETVDQGDGRRPTFVRLLGPRADFRNLQDAVMAFDPQLVIIDGASDTFDGNEIARREVRAFIKMLRRVHPLRPIAVLLCVHIDRSSARGHSSNDDGYAGSAQWHNSCRRRLFLQHVVKKERDEDGNETIVSEEYVLRVMKNQDGPPKPDTLLQRGPDGVWQAGAAEISGIVEGSDQGDREAALLGLIADYYARGIFMSTSLAAQATSGVFSTLRDDPKFPRRLNRKQTSKLIRKLHREGCLIEEPYKRANRSTGVRWAVARSAPIPDEDPSAHSAQG